MIGKSLAHYEITELLGKGGMGEVYRARDTKLDRDVALKLLPGDLGQDVERFARFRREAKVLASLNHTNIAAIHGLEEDQGQIFLVLELAQGEDLAARISRGPLAMDEIINVARQLAQGLEQAHERGVVHRDLKPANVKIADDATVKILDFGLARAFAGESAEEGDIGNSPTITAAMTQAGTILGTAAYMSPEQARGLDVDRRADIWAFGVMLHEMLTGKQLFAGDTISDTLAEVLKTEPDMDALPEETPVALRWLVERCLQKRPSRRLRDIGEARVLLESDLDEVPAGSSSKKVVIIERPKWVVPALVAVAFVAAGLAFVAAMLTQPEPPPVAPIHATLVPPPGTQIALGSGSHIALSPDATRVVFAARDSTGVDQLWVRRLDSPAAHVLSGTNDASYPFWSWDGRKIGFFSGGKLKKIDATGGVATAVCNAPNGRGGAWTQDDHILFAFEIRDHIQMVSAAGGEPMSVTEMDTIHFTHRWPTVLPDQKHFVYVRAGGSATDQLRWRSIDTDQDERTLLANVHRAMFADGHLFFGRDGALWARPFDPARGEFLGEEVLVAEAVITSSNFASGAFSVAQDGTLIYAVGARSEPAVMAVFDSDGNERQRFDFGSAFANDPSISPDGRFLAVAHYPSEGDTGSDVWIRDLQRNTLTRLTTNEGVDDPVWGPEGDRIVYSKGGEGYIYARSTRGSRELLWELQTGYDTIPGDWSADGKFVVASMNDDNSRSIYIVPVDDPPSYYPLVKNDHFNLHPSFSPDGQWVTYMSVESGEAQVYLRHFSEDGGTWQVSPGMGAHPRFNEDGSMIYYLTSEGLAGVPLRVENGEPDLGAERLQFRVAALGGRSNTHRWDISGDGQTLVLQLDPTGDSDLGTALELVVGWRQIVGHD